MVLMGGIVRTSVLYRILGAQALSSFGTSMSTVALAFMVYQITGSMLHMGGVLAASTFPLVVTSWIGGAVLDRFSAKNVMVLSDAVRAVLIFLMPFLAKEAVSLIYIVAGLMGVGSAFFNPGQVKLVGELVDRGRLVKANSYLSVSRDGAELAGYAAGGALVAAVGYAPAFFTDAGSYVLSGLLLLGLPRALPRTGPSARVVTLIAESPAVFARLWRHPGLRTNLLLAVFPTMAVMMATPNEYGLALEVFDRGAVGVAVLEASMACGLIAGGLIISRMALRGDKNGYVCLSFLVMAACCVGIYFSGLFWVSVALLTVSGAANVGMFVPSITMMQETAERADKGRMIALRAGFGQVGGTGGLLLGGVLGEALGITRMFLVAGLAVVGLSLVIYLPYSFGARRRARAAWAAALGDGARRAAARKAAREAAFAGPEGAWAMAVEKAALEEEA
jgi:MFS family permease